MNSFQSVSPGLAKTEFMEVAIGSAEEAAKAYEKNSHLQAEDIANAVMHILNAPGHVEVRALVLLVEVRTSQML